MVKIRLRRMGATKRPFYRVVVADSRSPRDGRFIESIGKYHPLDDPSIIEIDEDRALYWLSQGAQPSEQVQNLLKVQGIWERFREGRAGGGAGAGLGAAAAKPEVPAAETTAEAESPPAEEAIEEPSSDADEGSA